MQQSISFSLIIIPLCQTKLENSSLNVISFSVKSSPARLSPPRPGRSFQKFSCKAFTSSVGKIASNLLWQGFHLLDRADRFQTISCKAFTSSTGQIVFKPSHARFSPPRPEVRCILQQSPEVCLLAEDSVHRIWHSRRNARFSPI